jgi:dihydroflavonol-4-reductase
MKVLITGATGLLGNHVARALAARGHQVRVLTRPTSDRGVLADVPCEYAYGDLCNAGALREAVVGVEAVVHSAAVTAAGVTADSYYEEVNLQGTVRLVEAMQRAGCRRLVHVSTANTLGPGSRRQPGTESSPFALQHYGSGYVNTKYQAEQFVLSKNGHGGLEAVVVNPTFMIGSHDYKPSSGQLLLHGLRPVQLCPPGGKNFVPVKDAAQGVCEALLRGQPGRNYLLAGDNLTYAEFFDKVQAIAGRRPFRVKVPRPLFHLAGLTGTALGKVRRKEVDFNYVNARLLSLDNYYSGQRAREELQMPHTSLDDAIREALAWFRENGYIRERAFSPSR